MSEPAPDRPPRRFLLRPAGVLTQLIGALCLLLGTISIVLVIQNKSGGIGFAAAWAVAAMAALVFGGLMARGGLVSVLGGAALDVTFGIVLAALDEATLRSLLRLLPPSDVEMIGAGLDGAAIVMGLAAVLCLASIPQARRYHAALRAAEAEAAASGIWIATIPTTLPGPGVVPPTVGYGRGGAGSNPAHSSAGTNHPHPYPHPGPAPGAHPTSNDPITPWAAELPPPAAATNRGWIPSAARTGHTTMMIVRPPAEEKRSRRRVYFALGGLAIGVGAGVGVLLSASSGAASASGTEVAATGAVAAGSGGSSTTPGGAAGAGSAGTQDPVRDGGPDEPVVAAPTVSVRTLVAAQREAIAKADAKALAELVAPTAFAFGLEARDVAEGREAIERLFQTQLADAPPDGFTVASKFLATGQERNHAWTAEELELSAPGEAPRRIAITQLAAFVDGAWTVVALHWARPVPDATAERLAILGTLPSPAPVPNRADGGGDLAGVVRAAFASRRAFAEARSEREDGFNFGSGPGERIVGGSAVKRVFGKLRAELRANGGARVVGGGAWDPAQRAAPWIGFVALNVDFITKTRAATELTYTFRVLAVLLREGDRWTIVQTQFSHAGPIN